MTQAQNNQVPAYFNLTADGIGFLNRPRVVEGRGKNSSGYFACTIQALRGDADDKSRFDLRVVGGRAKELMAELLEAFPNLLSSDYRKRPTVTVGFRAGDLQPVHFETKAKNDKGEQITVTTPSIDGRLLQFKFIKVGGQVWYSEKDDVQTDAESDAPGQEAHDEAEAAHAA